MAGVEIIATLERKNGANFALIKAEDALGAFVTVADIAARDAIPTAILRVGAIIRIGSSTVFYEWNGSAWITFTGFGSSGGAIDWKDSVKAATTAALAASTRVSNTRTANANGAFPTIDGVSSWQVGDRILDKDHATGADRGLWAIVSLGSGGTPWVLARTSDADTDSEVTGGMRVAVVSGTANGGKVFKLDTADPITLNTTSLSFSVDSGGGGSSVTAGNGLTDTAGTFSVDAADATLVVGAAGVKRAPITGDITIADGSNTAAIAADSVVNADINSAAAIAWSKLAANVNRALAAVTGISFTEVPDGASGAGTKNIDWSAGSQHSLTADGNATLTFTAPAGPGTVQLRVTMGGSGGYVFTLPASAKTLDGIVWAPNPNVGSTSYLVLDYDGAGNYYYYGRAPDSRTIPQTSTSRTLGLADSGGYIRATNASATTITVPPNSTTAFPIDTLITGVQAGAGQVTLAPGSGVTINKPASRNRKTAEQFSCWALKKVAADEWDLTGDLEVA